MAWARDTGCKTPSCTCADMAGDCLSQKARNYGRAIEQDDARQKREAAAHAEAEAGVHGRIVADSQAGTTGKFSEKRGYLNSDGLRLPSESKIGAQLNCAAQNNRIFRCARENRPCASSRTVYNPRNGTCTIVGDYVVHLSDELGVQHDPKFERLNRLNYLTQPLRPAARRP